jgi:membrane protease YdiL (CAAX protease family)
MTHVTIFYGIMGGLAALVGWALFDELPIQVMAETWGLWAKALLGALLGLAVVGLSRLFNSHYQWAQRLEEKFRTLLGDVSLGAAAWMALTSALAEELLFRGLFLRLFLPNPESAGGQTIVLAVVVTALIFGVLHIGPDRSYAPWTAFALTLGLVFGAITVLTGDIVAVVIAHMTINYFNFLAIAGPRD